MSYVPDIFGINVFNDDVMKERLPEDIYASLHDTIDAGTDLNTSVAQAVASAMKDWAIEKGATHYTHWFQPMTGITAEKHDSFISPVSDSKVIMDFSAKELIKGEPDASSFPSGGLRATFEARGYTAWDPTSYAFIKDDSLCIPTVFCSYSGDVLDKKTPLLRSMQLINDASLRILKLFGITDVTRVIPEVGAEQEYFLVDKAYYLQRKDLMFTGRTLFGANAPKGQEMDDHYYGAINPRVMEYMRDLNEELWKLGVFAKTEHNEAAPAQHELAPLYTSANIATDQNQLMMELMKKVADKHGMACLLHEKPFKGVNGSGKHNNWSLQTNTGVNLFKPGKKPEENKLFLLMLCAVIEAVDKHQDLLRLTVATASNDCRLGGSEAPPAIVSMFLGDELISILDSIESSSLYNRIASKRMDTGVHVLPDIKKDKTDRNRTSPFAFTGNKFEFRMPGSSLSVSGPNIVLNTIVADVLFEYADRLEKAESFETALHELMAETLRKHKRILFNGNNYAEAWVREAEARGLLNMRTAVDALPCFNDKKNIELFTKHKIFTETELRSRCEILLEFYSKTINIEALTMLEMSRRDIIPSSLGYIKLLTSLICDKKTCGFAFENDADAVLARRCTALTNELYNNTEALGKVVQTCAETDALARARYYCDVVKPAMEAVRASADALEELTSADYWPYPTYSELMFGV